MNRLQLLEALKVAEPALGGDGAAVPALSHFCFEGDSFYAFNDVVAVIVGLETGLTLGLHGKTLLGVLGSVRSDEVEVKVKGKIATLTGAGRTELPVLGKEDFVFNIPESEPILSVPLSQEIKQALEVSLISVADDSLRPEYSGVTLRIGKSGTMLLSTDNLSATRVIPKAAKIPARKDGAVVLPKDAADLLLRLFPKEGVPKMHISEKIAIVELGGDPAVTMITKLLAAPSEKLGGIFDDHLKGTFCDIPEGIEEEVGKAIVLCSRDSLKEMTLFASKGELVITVEAALGKMRSVLELADKKVTGGVTVNPELVRRVLGYSDSFLINEERSLVLAEETTGLHHIISTVPKAQPAE